MEKRTKFSIWYYVCAFVGILVLQSLLVTPPIPEISYRAFRDHVDAGELEKILVGREHIRGWVVKNEQRRPFLVRRLPDDRLVEVLEASGVDYGAVDDRNYVGEFLTNWILPFALLALVWMFIYRRMGAGGPMTFGRSRFKVYDEQEVRRVTFEDVAGIDEAAVEVREIIDFLKDPPKFQKLGGRLPKGVLLVGPPGTGKTLLARAVAGEAGVPFFSLSASEFVEMFVGVGAARVRDLFEQAKQKAPCVVFIDEIDAIGRGRGHGALAGGHAEQEQTLNQLLVEMDGFSSEKGVILMAATNRADVLDPALLRPGRFDRQILVDRPDLDGRVEIFKVHVQKMPLADDVDIRVLASQTPGMVGADIANICNEAALLAAREGREQVTQGHFQAAIERVIAGLERKSRRLTDEEKRVVAYHEAGHAIVGHFLLHAEPVQKITIVPRGLGALGYTLQAPLEDRYLMNREEILDRIANLLGGRAAEQVVFGRVTTGAQNDLERVTELARRMVCQFGMSESLGPVCYADSRQGNFLDAEMVLGRPFSEDTAKTIDAEVRETVGREFDRAVELLEAKRDLLEKVAEALLERESLTRKDFLAIVENEAEAA